MKHIMKLWNSPFKLIKKETKTIELRLNDEKRSLINVGDLIEFTNVETKEVITCKVLNLYKYPDFTTLYKYHNKTKMGYEENEIANPADMEQYYQKEDIKKYGVLAIEIELIKEKEAALN